MGAMGHERYIPDYQSFFTLRVNYDVPSKNVIA